MSAPINIEKYLANGGKKAAMTFSVLGKLQKFAEAMNSEIGSQILKDDIERHEELLIKVYNEEATPQELAEFRYLKDRIKKISTRIAEFKEGISKIKDSTERGA